jgi:hypothetical protein
VKGACPIDATITTTYLLSAPLVPSLTRPRTQHLDPIRKISH